MRLKLGARASDLARLQAYRVGDILRSEGHEVEYIFRESLGDLNPHIDLSKTIEKGVFTQDFYQDLVQGNYDLVVHSWKDLPTEERVETEIVATLPRADMRDVLLAKKNLSATSTAFRIFSSSPRRAYNLQNFFKWALPSGREGIEFLPVRGNVPTRIRKLVEGEEAEALIVAKAALDRLLSATEEDLVPARDQIRNWLQDLNWMVLPLSINPCAAAQGALAIEIRKGRSELRDVFKKINCEMTWKSVQEEREVLKSYGGGCHQKIGVSILYRDYGKLRFVKGLTDSAEVLDKIELKFDKGPDPKTKPALFPMPGQEPEWFTREAVQRPQNLWAHKDLWVAKAEALPAEFRGSDHQLLWTAGLQTWKALAAAGHWVNGTAESLGEQEEEKVDILLGRNPQWIKLSHESGFESKNKSLLKTYRLLPKEECPDLQAFSHFYWKSSSQFLQAWKSQERHLKTAHHSCGPGNTYSVLKEVLGSDTNLSIFLNIKDWWRYFGISSERQRENA